MRRRFGQSLRIGVGTGAVSLLRCARWGGAPEVLAECAYVAQPGEPGGGHGALLAALDRLLAADAGAVAPASASASATASGIGRLASLGGTSGADAIAAYAGWPVSFVLADGLLRLWQVAPPPGVARVADLEAAAALRFQSLYGEPASSWKIVADWNPAAPFFAAALPLPLLSALEQVADRHRLTVVAIAPHFIEAWNRWQSALAPDGWFGQVHDGLLSLGAASGRRLAGVRVLPVPPAATHDWLARAVAREALLLDLAPPARLQLCGQVPLAWAKTDREGDIGCQILDAAQRGTEAGWSSTALLARCGSAA